MHARADAFVYVSEHSIRSKWDKTLVICNSHVNLLAPGGEVAPWDSTATRKSCRGLNHTLSITPSANVTTSSVDVLSNRSETLHARKYTSHFLRGLGSGRCPWKPTCTVMRLLDTTFEALPGVSETSLEPADPEAVLWLRPPLATGTAPGRCLLWNIAAVAGDASLVIIPAVQKVGSSIKHFSSIL